MRNILLKSRFLTPFLLLFFSAYVLYLLLCIFWITLFFIIVIWHLYCDFFFNFPYFFALEVLVINFRTDKLFFKTWILCTHKSFCGEKKKLDVNFVGFLRWFMCFGKYDGELFRRHRFKRVWITIKEACFRLIDYRYSHKLHMMYNSQSSEMS